MFLSHIRTQKRMSQRVANLAPFEAIANLLPFRHYDRISALTYTKSVTSCFTRRSFPDSWKRIGIIGKNPAPTRQDRIQPIPPLL